MIFNDNNSDLSEMLHFAPIWSNIIGGVANNFLNEIGRSAELNFFECKVLNRCFCGFGE